MKLLSLTLADTENKENFNTLRLGRFIIQISVHLLQACFFDFLFKTQPIRNSEITKTQPKFRQNSAKFRPKLRFSEYHKIEPFLQEIRKVYFIVQQHYDTHDIC